MDEPEFRRDAFTGDWVVIAGSRQDRPHRPAAGAGGCPFCVGGLEAPDRYDVRAVANRWPVMRPGAEFVPDGAGGQVAVGACEVVLYSPRHDASLADLGVAHVRKVVDMWADRTDDLLTRPEVAYVLVFENRGAEVGATVDHPHGQIYAYPFVPPVAAAEAEYAAVNGCPACREVPRERGATTRVVHDGRAGGWLGWVPSASAWPYGLLLAPDRHIEFLSELDDGERDGLAAALVDVVGRFDALHGNCFPYMLWVHPGVHVHVHIAPPRRAPGVLRYVAAGELGSGVMNNPVAPERAAAELRGARPSEQTE